MAYANMYGEAIKAGNNLGMGVGSIFNAFWSRKSERALGKLQGKMAMAEAQNKAEALRMNAAEVSRIAASQEYALYKQQQANMEAMTARASNNGFAMEGSNVELLAQQAGVDAQNRDSMIADSKAKQQEYLFGAQQAIVEGRNKQHYYEALGYQRGASSFFQGITSGVSALAGAGSSGAKAYGEYLKAS